MVARSMGAMIRAVALGVFVSMPAVALSYNSVDGAYIAIVVGLVVGSMVLLEYLNDYPSFIEFRDAPPYNRIRFLFATLILFSNIVFVLKCMGYPASNRVLNSLGTILGYWLDFEYSPIRLLLLSMPTDLPQPLYNAVRMSAGFGFVMALIAMLIFWIVIKTTKWPIARGEFNVWTNLPLFNPYATGDIVIRLDRDGRINVVMGIIAPFAIPALIKIYSSFIGSGFLLDPQTLVWIVFCWVFFPVTFLMRGLSILRVAELIQEKRMYRAQKTEMQMV